jgi:hypothetical protein
MTDRIGTGLHGDASWMSSCTRVRTWIVKRNSTENKSTHAHLNDSVSVLCWLGIDPRLLDRRIRASRRRPSRRLAARKLRSSVRSGHARSGCLTRAARDQSKLYGIIISIARIHLVASISYVPVAYRAQDPSIPVSRCLHAGTRLDLPADGDPSDYLPPDPLT